jgi:hypothetical protein
MRFILFILIILAASWVAHLFLPWWIPVVVAAVVALFFRQGAARSFTGGFVALLLLWGVYAWYLNSANDGLLAARIGELFGGLSPAMLVATTALVGGLFGGLGALTGALGAQAIGHPSRRHV